MTVLCAAILAGETVNFFSGNPLKGPFMYHMLENPRHGYIPIAGGRDVGRDVPDFTPLPIDAVTRHVVDGREDITVYGQPFERWYSDTGNILNKPRTKEGS